jgi:hypothetical protein
MEAIMATKIVKAALVLLMLAGIFFSAFNFMAVRSEAGTLWQHLDIVKDPVTGIGYRCWKTGQSCVLVDPHLP